jgi:hypothetical protein
MTPEMKRAHPKKENKNTAWLVVCSTPQHGHLASCLPPKEFKKIDEKTLQHF